VAGGADRLGLAAAPAELGEVGSEVGALVLAAALAASVSARSATLGRAGSSRGRLLRSRVTAGHAELVVDHLAPSPPGEIYEVWLARPDRMPLPTGALFVVSASGDDAVDVPGDLHGVQQVMVTREPSGGSSVPTQPAVITADLT
jgi:Anti-sigma-K factor rskA